MTNEIPPESEEEQYARVRFAEAIAEIKRTLIFLEHGHMDDRVATHLISVTIRAAQKDVKKYKPLNVNAHAHNASSSKEIVDGCN